LDEVSVLNILDIGLGNFVNSDQVAAIVNPESAPIKRIIQEAKDNGKAVDATYGRRTRAVLVMVTGQVLLSSIQPATIIDRNQKKGRTKE
jgi:regulator of extracellular matrix RemA (YlzA/DUF370 family)